MNAAVNSFELAPRAPAPYSAVLNTIVIVGGGFCGTVLAANLLRRPPAGPTKIVLIERGDRIGRGVAYAAGHYPYLLNVPAARMSADSSDPLEFLSFAQARIPRAGGEDFLPRALYGEYLEEVLLSAERAAPCHVHFERIYAEAQRIAQLRGNLFRVELDNGLTLFADDVVLASGNPPPAELPGARELSGHSAYIENPWNLRQAFRPEQSVLIVGTGLTMADVVLKLTDDVHDRGELPMLHAISRRGLVPLRQSAGHGAAQVNADELIHACGSTRRLLAATRRLAREIERSRGDWRDLITAVRTLAPQLWQRLPLREKQRFTRHVQSYWDVCRHRLPAQVGEHLEYVRDRGKLQIHAGRIQMLMAQGPRIRVHWRARGQSTTQTLIVDAVVNATGPDYGLTRSRDRLLQSLHAEGLITPDPLGVGLRTGAQGAVVGKDHRTHDHLFYLGPMLRAGHWETTAAAELRGHAEQLAGLLAGERT